MFAGENRLQGLPEQEDFSSYPLAGMKGSADPRRPPCCPSKRRQAGTFLTLASFSLEPPSCHRARKLKRPPLKPFSYLPSLRNPQPQLYLLPSPDHRLQQGSSVADGGVRNVRVAMWKKKTEHQTYDTSAHPS